MGKLFDSFRLRKYQVNPEGGMIYVDRKVEKWLDSFKNGNFSQKSEDEIEIYRRITKSGIEEDQNAFLPKSLPNISLVLVTYNSDFWMNNLNKMFSGLSDWLYEIIVVDNGSVDNCVEKLTHNEKITILKNDSPKSFAAAVNQGCRTAKGDLFLIINPDVVITKSALFSLIDFYLEHPDAAAIVPKLLLLRTPGFINGVGNVVPFFRWGYDLGLGHLDVGQFDGMLEVPSACFATVLISRDKWNKVGELDEGYPMYYEDSDWSYRARGIGYKILINPKSEIYHAYGGYLGDIKIVSNQKILYASYGRLRLISKLFPEQKVFFYFTSYLLFDILFSLYSLITLKLINIQMVFIAWSKFISEKSTMKQIRREKVSQSDNFGKLQNQFAQKTFQPRIRFGNPKLEMNSLNLKQSVFEEIA